MPCKDPSNIPRYESSNLAAYLQELRQGYIFLEAQVEETAAATGYQLEDMLPLLYDEHWEPLRWRMRTLICNACRSCEVWVEEEIQKTLETIRYPPMRLALAKTWENSKTRRMEKKGAILREGVKEETGPVGKVMSEEQRKRAWTWMLLQQGSSETILWQDAVMAVWKGEIISMTKLAAGIKRQAGEDTGGL